MTVTHHDHHQHDTHASHHGSLRSMAASATLHCLTGCAIGEIAGLVIGTAAGLSNLVTIALSVSLAFVFGYTLSTLPLLKAGLGVGAALSVVLAADTLSILTMEVVDNAVMATVPGAMEAGLVSVVFWLAMALALTVAFAAAYPVNLYLLRRGKGHALTHEYHGAPASRLQWIPTLETPLLVAAIVSFILGGLLVSVADRLEAEPTSLDSAASRASVSQHNDADVQFVQAMVPHHQQAIEMARLAEARSSSTAVEGLAEKIEAAQRPEIDSMTGWLRSWDVDSSGSPRDADSGHGMGGMMSANDMAKLKDSSGSEFDTMFLEMMIEHHEGATMMAEQQLSKGVSADALALAASVRLTQQAEIEQMRDLLES